MAAWAPAADSTGTSVIEVISQKVATFGSTNAKISSNVGGKCLTGNGTTGQKVTTTGIDNKNNAITVMVVISINVTSRGDVLARWTNGAGAGDQFDMTYGINVAGVAQLFMSTGAGSFNTSTTSVPVMSSGNIYVVIGGYLAGIPTYKMCVNGVLNTTTGGTNNTLNASPTTAWTIMDNNNGNGTFNGQFYGGAVWNRLITDNEILSLSTPIPGGAQWQIFQDSAYRTY